MVKSNTRYLYFRILINIFYYTYFKIYRCLANFKFSNCVYKFVIRFKLFKYFVLLVGYHHHLVFLGLFHFIHFLNKFDSIIRVLDIFPLIFQYHFLLILQHYRSKFVRSIPIHAFSPKSFYY